MTKITVEGIPNALSFLSKKKVQTERYIQTAMVKVGAHVDGEVKQSISGRRAEPRSVDTGNLMRSVQFEANKDSVTIFTDVPYADHLEYGTSRISARNHFKNTKSRTKQKVRNIIDSEVKKI